MENLIYKSLGEIKDFDEAQGIIKGYGNVYNVRDSDGDISLFGSFAKTAVERKKKIRIYKNHSPVLVGAPLDLDISDPYGLGVTVKILMDTDAGRDAFYESKFLNENGFDVGMSIGGWIIKRGKNKGEVSEYKLKEISILTTDDPANELSLITAIKSIKGLEKPTQDEFWRVIEKAYNEKFSDNVLKSLEQFLTIKDSEPSAGTHVINPSNVIKSIYELYI